MKKISLTGDRPTGPLHIGHLIGSLLKRVEIQDTHKSFVMIADAQAYTDHINKREKVSESILQVMEDYISVGIDPNKSTIFLQSAVPEIQELSFYLSNLVNVSRLERIPTVRKEIFEKFSSPDVYLSEIPRDIPTGFLTYPISQSADILTFNTDVIPVGTDQIAIIELTNEIVKIFNRTVGKEIFKPCQAIVDRERGTLPGIDGKAKMSKTLGNTINLNSSPDEVKEKVKKMFTDPNHIRVSDPGQVEGNMVFTYLDYFYKDLNHLEELKAHYRKGGLGDSVVKNILIESLNNYFSPIREKRSNLDKTYLLEILKDGTFKAREDAALKISEVKKALGLSIF